LISSEAKANKFIRKAEKAFQTARKTFVHPDKMGRVTVPHPKKEIPIGTLKSIERQSGIRFS